MSSIRVRVSKIRVRVGFYTTIQDLVYTTNCRKEVYQGRLLIKESRYTPKTIVVSLELKRTTSIPLRYTCYSFSNARGIPQCRLEVYPKDNCGIP